MGLPFSITLDDILIPEFCPVLGIRLEVGGGDAAPSLDRIIPELGYCPGNVVCISSKANRMKSNGTADEISRLAAWLQTITPKDPTS